METNTYKIEIKFSIKEINKHIWEEICGEITNPFYKWEWLFNLERSKSVANETGWQPLYFLVYNKQEIESIAPLFLKNHSYGEFIFDQSFARLAQDLNLKYYPKLIGMSPYSPIEGYQFFYKENANKYQITKKLINYIEGFALRNKILSCNFLYVNSEWGKLIKELGYNDWLNTRSEWEYNGENDFEDYLQRFNSNQRKNIRKERKSIINQGIHIKIFSAESINNKIIKNMYDFYEQHCLKWGVWGSKYLTYKFFEDSLNCKENILLFAAFRETSTKPIAMSMCIKNRQRLWGRYWGSTEDINNLHFELCYYQPIEWAIKNNINFFDPGAGGQQKRRRGFYAKSTKSLHKWFNVDMENLINKWLIISNKNTIRDIDLENKSLPFKK
tara:strand:+ start:548 stop:1705 length:1158 start_codon:yes stop_codon:yes gene_type:complete